MKNKNKFIFCSLVLLVYFLLFILKPIYQYYLFSKMDVNSSMVQLIQDKYEKYWNDIDGHIHLEKSKENGQNIGIIYVIDNDNQIESKISSKDGEVLFGYNNRLQGNKRVEISWLNGEKRLRHAGRYLNLASENQAVIESSTGSSVTVWEQRSDNAMNQLHTVVNQMRKRVLNHLLQKIFYYSIALVCFLLGWKIYYLLKRY
mgnify:CR=1 FL=1